MSDLEFGTRLRDIRRFYDLLDRLEAKLGGKRTLATADGRMSWPTRGVYCFFEPGEMRTTSGTGLRVVRIGTHALKAGARAKLWGRLRQHRGHVGGGHPGGGNHRASVFRRHVGTALIRRDHLSGPAAETWGVRSNALRAIADNEYPLERAVSQDIRGMPFLWVGVDDEPGPGSVRGYIERNAVALLSSCLSREAPIDPPSAAWLGHYAASEGVRLSGLWNSNHVRERRHLGFLDVLEKHIT